MQRIEPEAVAEAVHRLSGAGFQGQYLQARMRLHCLPIITEAPGGRPLGVVVRASLD
jgi:hypothetical protein